MYTNELTVTSAAREILPGVLVNYLWRLVEDRDDNHSNHTFFIARDELYGMELVQITHEQAGDTRRHKLYGINPLECVVRVCRQNGAYVMGMGWEECAA